MKPHQAFAVGFDGSRDAASAVRWAFTLAGQVGADVVLVHALGLLEHGERARSRRVGWRLRWISRLSTDSMRQGSAGTSTTAMPARSSSARQVPRWTRTSSWSDPGDRGRMRGSCSGARVSSWPSTRRSARHRPDGTASPLSRVEVRRIAPGRMPQDGCRMGFSASSTAGSSMVDGPAVLAIRNRAHRLAQDLAERVSAARRRRRPGASRHGADLVAHALHQLLARPRLRCAPDFRTTSAARHLTLQLVGHADHRALGDGRDARRAPPRSPRSTAGAPRR